MNRMPSAAAASPTSNALAATLTASSNSNGSFRAMAGARLRRAAALALVATLALAGPAAAEVGDLAPGGGETDDGPVLIPVPPQQDEPTITIATTPTCAPSAGVDYVIDVHDAYPGQHLYEAHWSVDEPLLFPLLVANPAGFVATGEGDFVFRGQAENLGQLGWFGQTDWTTVTVDCSSEPEDEPEDEPDDDPNDGPNGDGDDDIVEGDPNFTG